MTSVRTEHEQNRNDMLSLFDAHTFRVLGHSDDNRSQLEMFSVKLNFLLILLHYTLLLELLPSERHPNGPGGMYSSMGGDGDDF